MSLPVKYDGMYRGSKRFRITKAKGGGKLRGKHGGSYSQDKTIKYKKQDDIGYKEQMDGLK